MTRSCLLAVVLTAVLAQTSAKAEPVAPGKATAARPAKATTETSPRTTAKPTPAVSTPAADAARPADLKVKDKTAPKKVLDLTPSRLFDPGGPLARSTRKAKEGTPGLTLGDDSDWKVQAAQVGAMVGVFGALFALCGSGNCALPADLLPGFLRSEEGPTVDSRPAPTLRDGR